MDKIYFASPWFTEAQAEREQRLIKKLRELNFNVFSPRENSNISNSFNDSLTRKNTFLQNIENINDCDIIFAVTDGKNGYCSELDKLNQKMQAIDPGTIWEAGYAYGLRFISNKDLIIIYYAETLGNAPFNLMLQESADIVITDFNDLNNLSIYIKDVKNGIRKIHNGVTE